MEAALEERRRASYVLQLFVCGMGQRSAAAIASVAAICEQWLPGRHTLQIIDLQAEPGRSKVEQLVAAPTLVRKAPLPVRRVVGDLTDRLRVLRALEVS